VGLDKSTDGKGEFVKPMEQLAEGFEGAMAVLVAKGNHLKRPATSHLKIIVPISGNERSQRAAEIAIALARSTSSQLSAVYIARGQTGGRNKASVTLAREEGILKDTVALADRFGLPIRTSVGRGEFSGDAILRQAAKEGSNLVVMGVDRAPGDTLSFGVTANTLLKKSKISVLLISADQIHSQSRPSE
jgi:nucleotide-binding universal stress UspA family protein